MTILITFISFFYASLDQETDESWMLTEHLESFGTKIKMRKPTVCQFISGKKTTGKQRKGKKF